MSRATKSALLSALVFPGAGHVFLKQYVSAVLFAGIALSATYYLVSVMIHQATMILEKIEQGQMAPDPAAINALLEAQTGGTEAQYISLATIAFVVVWLWASADAYRVGRRQDRGALAVRASA